MQANHIMKVEHDKSVDRHFEERQNQGPAQQIEIERGRLDRSELRGDWCLYFFRAF